MRRRLALLLLDVAVVTSKTAYRLACWLGETQGDSWDAVERIAPEAGVEVSQDCEGRVRFMLNGDGVRRGA